MRKWYLVLVFFGIAGLSGVWGQTLDEYWQFTRLYAADDTAGTTHLYYAQQKTRIYICDNRILEDRSTIHRYHNPITNVDSVLIPTHDYVTMPGCYGGGGVSIANFNPFDGSPENAMFVGGYSDGHEPYAYMQIGSIDFYLSPLFGYFDEVIANPNLGDTFFLDREGKTVQLPITDNQDTLNFINDAWYDLGYVDTLSGYYNQYDFILYSLSRFNDSLAFYQKDGAVYRSENFGDTDERLDASLNQNSQFHYDADSLHIYVTQERSNSVLVSNNYGKAGSWSSIELPSSKKIFTLDSQTPGLVFFADSRNIYRSTNFAASFEIVHSFNKQIQSFYKKPASDIYYVLFKDELVEITGEKTIVLKKIKPKKKLDIGPDNLAYKEANEFTFRISEKESQRVPLPYYKPVEDFKMIVTEVTDSPSAEIRQQINFESNSTRPLFSKLTIHKNNNIVADSWINQSNISLFTNNKLHYNAWSYQGEQDSTLQFVLVEDIEPDLNLGIDDTTTSINYYIAESTDTSKTIGSLNMQLQWSNAFGIKQVTFNADTIRYLLKGAVIDGTVYGDTTRTIIVSNEPEPSNIPTQITLEQNYPNPFNPTTVIRYQLTGNSVVQLKVFDVTGRKVATLVNGQRQVAGNHRVSFDASGLSSGVYFYRLETAGQTLTRKMLLLK